MKIVFEFRHPPIPSPRPVPTWPLKWPYPFGPFPFEHPFVQPWFVELFAVSGCDTRRRLVRTQSNAVSSCSRIRMAHVRARSASDPSRCAQDGQSSLVDSCSSSASDSSPFPVPVPHPSLPCSLWRTRRREPKHAQIHLDSPAHSFVVHVPCTCWPASWRVLTHLGALHLLFITCTSLAERGFVLSCNSVLVLFS